MPETPDTVARNIETILRLEDAALRRRSFADRLADGIAGFVGTVLFVLLHLLWFALWATINTGVLPVVKPFDPYPFQLLCMIVSMEGVLLSTFVLIKQNRMGYLTDRRAHVDLQINLLTEREVTQLLQLSERIAERLGVDNGAVAAAELSRATPVERLVETLDTRLNAEMRPNPEA
ncbi:MAG: DUF1003 domain-containing protein [Rhodospirillales bacterium]|nr:DUF1003 domain-containing protein [Rhodospirillales bacterium]